THGSIVPLAAQHHGPEQVGQSRGRGGRVRFRDHRRSIRQSPEQQTMTARAPVELTMIKPSLMSAIAATALGALALPAAIPALAQAQSEITQVARSNSSPSQRLSMGVGKSVIVDLPRDAAEIFVGNPDVANAIV